MRYIRGESYNGKERSYHEAQWSSHARHLQGGPHLEGDKHQCRHLSSLVGVLKTVLEISRGNISTRTIFDAYRLRILRTACILLGIDEAPDETRSE